MEPKSKNLELSFWFLVVCMQASFAFAGVSSEKFEMTGLLISHSAKLLQDMNTPSITMQELVHSGLKRQLWQAKISALKSEKEEKNKDELQWLIEQIRSVEFRPPEKAAEPLIAVEPAKPDEPNETLPTIATPKGPNGVEDRPRPPVGEKLQSGEQLPYKLVSKQTLQMLESLLQHPERLDRPFELAEVLFLSGYLKQASVCYQEALSRTSPDKADPMENRAWIIFQVGNCLRDDAPRAMEMYRQLIAEYPDSSWADLAKTWNKLIDWYQKDKPRALIAENQF